MKEIKRNTTDPGLVFSTSSHYQPSYESRSTIWLESIISSYFNNETGKIKIFKLSNLLEYLNGVNVDESKNLFW